MKPKSEGYFLRGRATQLHHSISSLVLKMNGTDGDDRASFLGDFSGALVFRGEVAVTVVLGGV